MKVAIETQHLSKTYGQPGSWRRSGPDQRTAAVSDVSLMVPHGELFGLLGANGAGKTTLVKILCTLVLPDSGSAQVAGYDLAQAKEIRRAVGLVISDERSFYWRLTAQQNLAFFAAMYELPRQEIKARIGRILEVVDLLEVADKPFSVLSAGMRQRLAIARSLLHRPQLLFLDEPSRSLDPLATSRLHDLIRTLNRQQGVTIFLITHDLVEAEKLCQRVAVMSQGRIQITGRPTDLRRRLKSQTEYVVTVDALDETAEQALHRSLPELEMDAQDQQTRLVFSLVEGGHDLTAILDILRERRARILNVESRRASLEEVFSYYSSQKDGQA